MGRNNADFHGVQISYRGMTADHPRGNGTPMHHFVAEKDGKEVGYTLFEEGGKLDTIDVSEGHQRQGIGTAMWNAAKNHFGSVSHADVRTPEGDEWAKAVGGYRPKNTMDWAEDH